MNMHTTPPDPGHDAAALRAALRNLPSHAPGRDAWPAVRARVLRGRARRRAFRRWLPTAAAAALLLGLAAGWSVFTQRPEPRAVQVQASRLKPPAGDTAAAEPTLAELQAHSMRLERWLAELRAHGAPLQGQALASAIALQDRVGLIDLQLAAPGTGGDRRALWRQRIGLLQDLAMLRATQSPLSGASVVADSRDAAYRF